MPLEVWLSFTLTTIVLVAIPGPTVMIVVSYALGQGRSTAWATVPAVALADFTAMTISLAGAGAILATSATLFTALKMCGAAYLLWLGYQMWRSKPRRLENLRQVESLEHRKIFWRTFVVTVLNPKGIVFFVAFVPLFVNPAQPVFTQFAIFEATFVIVAAINVLLWALLASSMRERFSSISAQRVSTRIGGSFLIGAGLLTALARRTA